MTSRNDRNINSPVLLLNKSWQAIDTISVRQAIIDMTRGSVKALCMETYMLYSWEDWISPETTPVGTGFIKAAGDKRVVAPDVVACTRYDKIHIRSLYLGKRSIHIRDGFTCQYCKKQKRPKELSIDHVFPRSRGGENSWENCVTACIDCNQRKADKTLKEAGLILTPKPARPQWSPVAHLHPESYLDTWKKLLHQPTS